MEKLTIIYIHDFFYFLQTCIRDSCGNDVMEDRTYGIVDHVLCPQRSKTETGNAEDQSAYGDALIPGCIGELEILCIGY